MIAKIIGLLVMAITFCMVLYLMVLLRRGNRRQQEEVIKVSSIREVEGFDEDYYHNFEKIITEDMVQTILYLDNKKVIINHI